MTTSTTSKPKLRFIADTGRPSPQLNLQPIRVELHAALSHWVANNQFVRDFPQAVEHCASNAHLSYLVAGLPGVPASGAAAYQQVIQIAAYQAAKPTQAPVRLYSDDGELSGAIDLDPLYKAMVALFLNWQQQGALDADFVNAARQEACSLIYDFDICRSLGGLGGCRTVEQYLTEPLAK